MLRPAQLSALTVEHYTPPWLAKKARNILGGIDLDPFSCCAANTLIEADNYYSLTEDGIDGFKWPWAGKVFCNPPGGRYRTEDGISHNSQALAWYQLHEHWRKRLVTEAIFICFNLELFRYVQTYDCRHPIEFPSCYPKDRIQFYDQNLRLETSPAHSNSIIYLPPQQYEAGEKIARFRKAFIDTGYLTDFYDWIPF